MTRKLHATPRQSPIRFSPFAKPTLGVRLGLAARLTLVVLAAAAVAPVSASAAFSFTPRQDFPAGDNPLGVAVGDFNGDKKPDLAVAAADSGSVSILRGDGKGSFSAPTSFLARTSEDTPYSVAVGDFNNDGKQDLAVADEFGLSDSNVDTYSSVLLGDGNGNFGTAMPFLVTSGIGYPYKVAVADLNGDPYQDLFLAGSKYRVSGGFSEYVGLESRLLGDGSGAFPNGDVFSGNRDIRSIALADFNGDGNQDYAAARSDREDLLGQVTVALGDGTNSFSETFSSEGGNGATSVAAADFNGDQRNDLAVANYGSDNVSTYLGTGSGSFGGVQTFAAGNGPRSVVAADLDGDGDVDLATANAESNSIALLPGAGNGTFGAPTDFAAAAMSTLSAARIFGDGGRLIADDLNCDGAQDLVAVGNEADVVSVLINAQGATKDPGCDTTPPNTTITSGPADGAKINGDSVTFGFSSSEAGSTFECLLQPSLPDWKSCESPKGYTLGSSEERRVFAVRAIDPTGNVDPTAASRSFTVDRTPPDTKITKKPKSKIKTKKKSVKVKVSFESDEGATFKCKLDKADYKPCTSPYSVKAKSKRGKGKKHKIAIKAKDGAGNVGEPATVEFRVIRKG